MQDGIDLLYCDKDIDCSTQVDHVFAHSNGGNQIKISNTVLFFDNVLVGDCRAMRRIKYWPGATGTAYNDNNTCRAGGAPLAYSGYLGSTASIANNTFTNGEASAGGLGYTIGMSCRSQALGVGNCTGGYHSSNNIFYNIGGQEYPYYTTAATTPVATEDHNLFWNTRINCASMTAPQARGAGDVCGEDPMLVNPVLSESLDARLQARSPAIDKSTLITSVNDDLSGAARPHPPSIGAYELGPNPMGQKVALEVSPVSVVTGHTVMLFANVERTANPLPSGKVTFVYDNKSLGSATVDISGQVVLEVSTLPARTYAIRALYSGDATYQPWGSDVVTLKVLSPTSTALVASPTTVVYGTALSLRATVKGPGAIVPTGKVTFLNGSTSLGTTTLSSTGTATIASSLPVGRYRLTA
jgi:hypothetical protein